MLLPNRHGSSNEYRYGYNGMEKDDELKGEGNSYDYGARMLDPRIMRWFAPDPKESDYPSLSTYGYVANNPIMFIDPDGEEIRLSFATAAAQKSYIDLVNASLGANYTASVVAVKDANGYTNQIVLTKSNGVKVKLTKSQKAFLKSYKKAVNSKSIIRQEVVSNDSSVPVIGDFVNNKIDIEDVLRLDKPSVNGGSTSAGALIHETVEQLEKSKANLKVGDASTKFDEFHEKATKAENKVNGNKRVEFNGTDAFLESDGTVTLQGTVNDKKGSIIVTKNNSTPSKKIIKSIKKLSK